MEAKEILAKYKDQIIIHKQVASQRATRPLEAMEETPRTNTPLRLSDDMSRVSVLGVLNLNPKELTVRQEESLDYVIDEAKKINPDSPEQVILRLLSRMGEAPAGVDMITHLATYLKIRSTAEGMRGEILQ